MHAKEEQNPILLRMLKKQTFSKSLSVLKNMNHERLQLLEQNESTVVELLNTGVTIEQFAALDLSKLIKLLDNKHILQDLLKLVSMQQILGTSHTPPKVHKKLWFELVAKKQSHSSGKRSFSVSKGDFMIDKLDNKTIIIYKRGTPNESRLSILSGKVAINQKKGFEQQIGNYKARELVYIWDLLHSSIVDKQYKKFYYCAARLEYEAVLSDMNFPIELLMQNALNIGVSLLPAMYREMHFVNQISKKNWSIPKLLHIQGMSIKKIEILVLHQAEFNDLRSKGLSMLDIAKINEQRLELVLENYEVAKIAFELTNIHEVLGLNDASEPKISLFQGGNGMFKPKETASVSSHSYARPSSRF